MGIKYTNNASTTLASSITNSATSLTVVTGAGALFPTLTGSDYFYCTLEDSAATTREIVKVTARSSDTFTIVRGQDGTTGTAFNAGDKVQLRLVRAALDNLPKLDEANAFTGRQTHSVGTVEGPWTTAGRPSSPTAGLTGFNSTLGKIETYNGTAWVLSGGATGGNGDDVFYENSTTVTANYTLSTGKNAMSVGPITVNSGIAVTVPSGARWVVL